MAGWSLDLRLSAHLAIGSAGPEDQSQSGYDLALANFGVDAGLKPQQIVDLIVHHRRIHAQKARTRLDYYMRTISAAMDRGQWSSRRRRPLTGARQRAGTVRGGGDGQDRVAPPTRSIVRAVLCDRVSKALGVQILGL